MTVNEFKKLEPQLQEKVLSEALEVYNLVNSYPCHDEDLKTFLEWQKTTGMFKNKLRDFFIGIYPNSKFNKELSEEELRKILELSNAALEFVKFWNKQIQWKLL